MQCSLCGYNIPSNSDFCLHCGKYRSQRSNLGFRPSYRREQDNNLHGGTGHHAGQHQCPNCEYWNSGRTGRCINCNTTLSPSFSYAFGRHGSTGYASVGGNQYRDPADPYGMNKYSQRRENRDDYYDYDYYSTWRQPDNVFSVDCPQCKGYLGRLTREEGQKYQVECSSCHFVIDQFREASTLHQNARYFTVKCPACNSLLAKSGVASVHWFQQSRVRRVKCKKCRNVVELERQGDSLSMTASRGDGLTKDYDARPIIRCPRCNAKQDSCPSEVSRVGKGKTRCVCCGYMIPQSRAARLAVYLSKIALKLLAYALILGIAYVLVMLVARMTLAVVYYHIFFWIIPEVIFAPLTAWYLKKCIFSFGKKLYYS